MVNEIVRAGHRYYGLHYLILGEDGAHPDCDDPALPRDVLRLTIATGRQIDLRGGPADEMRRNLDESSGRRGRPVTPGYDIPPPGPSAGPGPSPTPGAGPVPGPTRRRRVTE